MFWALAIGMAVIVAAALLWALLRESPPSFATDGEGLSDTSPGQSADLKVYRDQLKAIADDVARGVIAGDEANRIKLEISRRILEADRTGPAALTTAPKSASIVAAVIAAVLVVGGSGAAYWWLGAPGYADLPLKARIAAATQARENRPDQAIAEAAVPAFPPAATSSEFATLMTQLRTAVAARPDDLQGQELLARNESALGNFAAAHTAQSRIIDLKGADATAEDFATLADLLVLAAGGYVSPEAEAALNQALGKDNTNSVARFYAGLMHSQTGRPDLAFRFWEPLLRSSLPDDPWVVTLRERLDDIAMRAGVEYSLPPLSSLRGPTADDVEAASEMSAEGRMQMIRGMVDGLSEELGTQGGPPPKWAQLIRALGVLGQRDRAAAIWAEAQQVFPDPATRIQILQAARDAGVAE